MSPTMERWVIDASLAIADWLVDSLTVLELRDRLAKADARMSYLNDRERAFLRDNAEAVGRSVGLRRFGRLRSNQSGYLAPSRQEVARVLSLTTVQQRLSKIANAMDRRLQTKAKTALVAATIQKGRDGMTDPTVFYLSTQHQSPASGHKEWQGKLYVDRYWRSTLEGKGYGAFVPIVESIIKERGICTVQWVMGPPVWLVMRPNCRHHFIPIPLHEALGLSLSEIKARHPEHLDHAHRSMTDEMSYERQKRRMRAVRERIERIRAKTRSGA